MNYLEPLPEIDRRFLNNQQANSAVEGTPYIVQLPTMVLFTCAYEQLLLTARHGTPCKL